MGNLLPLLLKIGQEGINKAGFSVVLLILGSMAVYTAWYYWHTRKNTLEHNLKTEVTEQGNA